MAVAIPDPKPGTIFPAPYTAANDREIVVFLIGMRFNGLRGIGHAARAFFAMPKMLAALGRSPEKGCLGGHVAFGWRVTYVIQYWRSFEDLERFAHAPDDEHHPAWRWYNRLGKNARDVGIWHETFRVPKGGYESIYVNMPQFGLAKATAHVAVERGTRSARARIDAPVDETEMKADLSGS